MQGFDDAQRQAMAQSVGDVQGQIAGTGPRIGAASAAYDDVPAALRNRRDALKEAGQTRYERTVDDPNILVSGEAVREIPNTIRQALDANQIVVDPMYHQGAARAMRFVDDYIGRMPKPSGDISDVRAQLKWVENLRAGLRKNFPAIGQDAPAIRTINRALEDWTNDVFDRGLVNASDDVLKELKDARKNYAEYKAMAEPRSKIGNRLNPRYEAQARIRSIMDKDMSPEEIGRYLWGTSVATPKASSFMTARELKSTLGGDSDAWSGIRQSFWLRATRAGDQEMNPAQIAKNLHGFLKDNEGLASVLYSADERRMMTAYANVMRYLSAPKAGINGSNTANRIMPTLRKYASGIMGALAAGGGLYSGLGPLESTGLGAVASTSLRGLSGLADMSRASAATRMPVPANSSGVGGAVLRGGGMPMLVDQNKGKVTVLRGP